MSPLQTAAGALPGSCDSPESHCASAHCAAAGPGVRGSRVGWCAHDSAPPRLRLRRAAEARARAGRCRGIPGPTGTLGADEDGRNAMIRPRPGLRPDPRAAARTFMSARTLTSAARIYVGGQERFSPSAPAARHNQRAPPRPVLAKCVSCQVCNDKRQRENSTSSFLKASNLPNPLAFCNTVQS